MPSVAELLPALLVVAAVLGLAVGSFLNVVIHRLPLGLSLSHPGSRCPSCGTPIKARHNVPVLGWLVLRGRCHTCRAPIGVRYPLVEAGIGLAFVAVVGALAAAAPNDDLGGLAPAPGWLWLTASLGSAALIDLDGHRVPVRFAVITPTVVAVLLVAASVPAGASSSLARAGVGAAALGGATLLLTRRIELVGFATAAGLALGSVSWLALVVGGALAVIGAAAGAFTRQRRLPAVALLTVAVAIGLLAAAVADH